jgi:ANTAR domain
MAGVNGGGDGQPHELYARAQAARRQSRALVEQLRATRSDTEKILQRTRDAWARAGQIRELWLVASTDTDRLLYSASARLQARLASMPVIERAKGVIMAQFGWPEDQAFDALRRASQQGNIKVRDLAATIVAQTACPAPAQRQPGPPRAAAPARERVTHAGIRPTRRAGTIGASHP